MTVLIYYIIYIFELVFYYFVFGMVSNYLSKDKGMSTGYQLKPK